MACFGPSPDVSRAFAGRSLVLLALAWAHACAARSVPDAPPATSAASLSAQEAPRAGVTAALDSDPPLPGRSDPRWNGLPEPAAGDAHAGHAHHHAHGSTPDGAPDAPR